MALGDFHVSGGTIQLDTSITVSHLVAGSNGYLYSFLLSDHDPTGVTWNTSEALSLIDSVDDIRYDHDMEVWGRLNPGTGTHNVVASLGLGQGILQNFSASGVDQGTPLDGITKTTGTGTTATRTVTSATGNLVIGFCGISDTPTITPDAGNNVQTIHNDTVSFNGSHTLCSSYEDGGASVTHSYTLSASADYGIWAGNLRAAAGGDVDAQLIGGDLVDRSILVGGRLVQ